MVHLKSEQDLVDYRKTGKIAAEVLMRLIEEVKPGVSTYAIAKKAEEMIRKDYQAIPSCIGQYGFKYALTTSVNEVVCHGVPSKKEILKTGDIINLDVTVKKHGWIADTSRMYRVGKVSKEANTLCDVTYACMNIGIDQVWAGQRISNIGYAIEQYAQSHGFSVVREYCGHGVGKSMHEDPQIAHYGPKDKGMQLKKGMVFTVEPMINQGKHQIKHLSDDWTAVTRDGKLSAQWEHTIALTSQGVEILTLREEEC